MLASNAKSDTGALNETDSSNPPLFVDSAVQDSTIQDTPLKLDRKRKQSPTFSIIEISSKRKRKDEVVPVEIDR
jgi:hypothetical protein